MKIKLLILTLSMILPHLVFAQDRKGTEAPENVSVSAPERKPESAPAKKTNSIKQGYR